jgi:hypothetical protein
MKLASLRSLAVLGAIPFLGLALLVPGCGGDSGTTPPADTGTGSDTGSSTDTGSAADSTTTPADTGSTGDSTTASETGGGDTGGASETGPTDTGGETAPVGAQFRIAHLSPDADTTLGPVAVCAKLASAGDFTATDKPVTPSLSFKKITSYVTVPAGTYVARIVSGTATDCSAAIAPAASKIPLPPLTDGAVVTIGAIGSVADLLGAPTDGGPAPVTAFTITVFGDDPKPAAGTNAHTRFIHASPAAEKLLSGGGVDVGTVTSGALALVAYDNVTYPNISKAKGAAALAPNANGYIDVPAAVSKATFGARAHGMTSLVWKSAAVATTGLTGGNSVTIFAVDGADAMNPVSVVACTDDFAAGTSGLNASCVELKNGS